jgi:MFS transporter, Spinster family, sphingosine-1-phosphate transporter
METKMDNLEFETKNLKADNEYLYGKKAAWFAFAMSIGLMFFDYIDRQVIVSLFPQIKKEWSLSDKELGALVSVVSIAVALAGIPVALIADRFSRVKSIFAMAFVWSLACVSCMFSNNYSQLLTARSLVGVGEAGYGSVGAALIASHFPSKLRGALLAGFFAAASVGSVMGVVLGGIIAAKWGWKSAFGVVGFPGLILAILYLKVKDYRTVSLDADSDPVQNLKSIPTTFVKLIKTFMKTRTMLWTSIGAALQVIVISSIWSWLPSYLNRVYSMAPDQAAIRAALVVLCGAAGAIVWGAVVDKVGAKYSPRHKLITMSCLCLISTLCLHFAFGSNAYYGLDYGFSEQFRVIALGGFFMTCTVGPVSAIVIDVVQSGARSTGSSVLSLFQNLFGLALGPLITGALSDYIGLNVALVIMPVFGVLAAIAFVKASKTYESDILTS